LSAAQTRPSSPPSKDRLDKKIKDIETPKVVVAVFLHYPRNGIVRGEKSQHCFWINFAQRVKTLTQNEKSE